MKNLLKYKSFLIHSYQISGRKKKKTKNSEKQSIDKISKYRHPSIGPKMLRETVGYQMSINMGNVSVFSHVSHETKSIYESSQLKQNTDTHTYIYKYMLITV